MKGNPVKFQFEEKITRYNSIVETARDEHGRFFRARIEQDDSNDAPWENSDMHGVVYEGCHDKRPEERILHSDRNSKWYYNVQDSMKQAKEQNWGCSHEDVHTTEGERRACAIEQDFRYLRGWFENDWWYVGVIVSLHQETDDGDIVELADHLQSVWGIECDAFDYLNETASELLAEALQTSEAHRCIHNV